MNKHGGDRKSSSLMNNKEKPPTYREMAKGAGVSVGSIVKAVKVHKLGRSQEVIDGLKTANEILQEEGLLPKKKPKRKKKDAFEICKDALSKLSLVELDQLSTLINEELEARVDRDAEKKT